MVGFIAMHRMRVLAGMTAAAVLPAAPAFAAGETVAAMGLPEFASLVLVALSGAAAGFAVATLLMRRKVQPLAADATREAALRLIAEERQAAARQDYQKLFEGSVDGIYVTTAGGAILNANRALARMMGFETPRELIDG